MGLRVKGLLHNSMKNILNLISNTCNQVTRWFDGTVTHFTEMVMQLANVAIRVLLAYALYALFVQDLLVEAIAAF